MNEAVRTVNAQADAIQALMNDADLDLGEAQHVFDADKAIIGGNWFVYLSDGQLAGGPVNNDGTLDWGMLTTIDMPDVFEHADLCRKARAMLDAGAAANAEEGESRRAEQREQANPHQGMNEAAMEDVRRFARGSGDDLERAMQHRSEVRGGR